MGWMDWDDVFILVGLVGVLICIVARVYLDVKQIRNERQPHDYNVAVGNHVAPNLVHGHHLIVLGDNAGKDLIDQSYLLTIGSMRWNLTHDEWSRLYWALRPILEKPQMETKK